MITKEQLIAMNGRGELHYTGSRECKCKVGPRGGIHLRITKVRLNGRCKTWKRNQEQFRQSVIYGIRIAFHIEQRNAADFHSPKDCPALRSAGHYESAVKFTKSLT